MSIAKKLKRKASVVFFQDNPQQSELVSFKPAKNIALRLPNNIALEQSRSETHFQSNHAARRKSTKCASDCAPVSFFECRLSAQSGRRWYGRRRRLHWRCQPLTRLLRLN